ncbi:MAG TPA: hypothetical protein DC054_09970 [Blastocatellia bacterium]|nr:hypothetical protein [Blastocatellia bacterium]
MRKLKTALKIVFINLAILVLLIEGVSVATYFKTTGKFFYAQSGSRPIIGFSTLPTEQRREKEITQQQLHPYFGFADRVGLSHRLSDSQTDHVSNNFGFASVHPYPFKRQNPNQFIVGILGGSVATYYSYFELENNILSAQLKKLPGLANKEIIVLPLAMGGFKEPQQLIVLNYFLSLGQDLDLVINIDGFNEIVLSYINYKDGLDTSMPGDFAFMPLVNLATGNTSAEELQLTLQVLKDRKTLKDSITSAETSRTATGYLIACLRGRMAQRRYRQGVFDLNELRISSTRSGESLVQTPIRAIANEDQALEQIVASWASASLMMKQLLDQRHIPYFEFVQPNQYHPTGRVFSKDEATIAINPASNFRVPVTKGYPLLLAEIGRMQQNGIAVQSAVNVFDRVSEDVYVDDCCHFNARGNRVFGEYVANAIQQALSREDRYTLPGGR